MLLAALRSIASHRFRLALSTFAITLAVAFVSGSLVFTNLLSAALTNIIRGTIADVNVAAIGTYQKDPTAPIDRRVQLSPVNLTAITSVPGVESVSGVVAALNAYPLDSKGRIMGTVGAPAVASNWFTAPAAEGGAGVVLRSGHPPETADEVVVDPETLTKSGLAIGDDLQISISGRENITKRIVGTAEWGDSGGSAGAIYLFFSTAEAQRLFVDGKEVFTSGWVVAKPRTDTVDLARRIGQVLPAGFEATSGKDAAAATEGRIDSSLGFLNTFLLVFAGISVLVASFLIVNTFNILVAQRARELALLRAIGAKRRQVRLSILIEACIVGLVSSTLGLFGGLGLGWAIRASFGAFGVNLGTVTLTLPISAVLASFGVGIGVTVVAALVPSVRASKMPPVVAMTGDVTAPAKGFGVMGWVGVGSIVLGVAAVLLGAYADLGFTWWFIGAGAVLTVAGTSFAAPLLGRPVVRVLGILFTRIHGEVGKLAERNAVRQPRRLAATASALTIGLALVTTVAVLGSSVKASLDVSTREGLRGDLQVSSLTGQPLQPSVHDRIASLPDVRSAYRLKSTSVSADGSSSILIGLDENSFDKVIEQKIEAGRFPTSADEAMVSQRRADSKGWNLGQTITVTTLGQASSVRIVGIFSDTLGPGFGTLIVNTDTFGNLVPGNTDAMITLEIRQGADIAAVRSAVEQIIVDEPTAVVTNTAEWADLQIGRVSTVIGLIYGLLGLALVISVLGIVNTLALAIIERTREIGLLRAVGLTRRQLRRMIGLEAVIVTVVGSVPGVALGLLFGVAVRQASASDGLNQLAIPWGQIVIFLLVAAILGVLASIWPARRASRLDVLVAIAAD